MSDINQLDAELNNMILSGKLLDAFEKFYADDVAMQENADEPRKGKDENRKFEQKFMSNVEQFHGAKLLASAVSGDASFSQWEWDFTFTGGNRVQMSEVAVRRWEDGQVVHERYYYKPAM